jgi:hypothetical protein
LIHSPEFALRNILHRFYIHPRYYIIIWLNVNMFLVAKLE